MSVVRQLVMMGMNVGSTTWNPLDKASDISLSNANLTASRSGSTPGDTHICVRSTTSKSAGKRYFEVVRTSGTNQINIGLTLATFVLHGSFNFPGTISPSTGSGVGYLTTFGQVQVQGSDKADLTASNTPTDVYGLAVDFGHGTFWVRLNGGSWNGDVTANPATNTGGVDISAVITAPAFITVDVPANDGTAATLRSNGGFAHTQPSGFTGWDG